ncbi:rod shape-determining protein MreC [bacterium SCSIO 12741]|nr:rod shape-determining protein MreC [bacterium SCSIO 12741]
MRNLIQFLWRHHFTILFVLAEALAFSILVQYNSFQKANFLGYANELTGGAFNLVNETTEYLELKEVNEQLAQENAELRSQLKTAYYSMNPEIRIIDDSTYLMQYEYIAAKVVNSTVSKRNNYLTLNVGSRFGIEPDMGVVTSDGVVGIVKNCSANYCTVLSLLHKNSQVSVRLKDLGYQGLLSWNGRNAQVAQLKDIPQHVNLSVGDSVVTHGGNSLFPANIIIGTVRSFDPQEGTDFYDIDVDLTLDFRKLSHVYVIRNRLKIEQQELEQQTEEEGND